ncbi:carboxypeptidase-like regulatory domain-containing protein, partial [uncultured Duncaniella sp.]|uniref:carboxypeptidase-like regulatory domain-containing protein n=1 Tax=uncultured Duncaniella sp. TaxID=2768039 RepID=UPI0027121970
MLLLLVLCVGFNADAQELTVTGTVTDSTEEPMIGATVQIDGTKNVVVTDLDGNFTLKNVAPNATLVVSYIGYKTEKIAVNGQSTINVVLTEDSEALDEVVVIGYGSVKKSTLTGAVTKMDSKGIENRPLARAETALQGQLAGVQVRTTT